MKIRLNLMLFIIENDRTLVPIRAIFEQMGANVAGMRTKTATVEKWNYHYIHYR